ncbi:hypothetical protein [Reinekea sp.]|uniref:hypothetical protein n=2 Tax=Reinekea sp. TaxID=1970455 RepID=UPI0039897ED6
MMSTVVNDNVIRLSQKRPEMALERLKRSTGLDFDAVPQSLVNLAEQELTTHLKNEDEVQAPVLTEIVEGPVWAKQAE